MPKSSKRLVLSNENLTGDGFRIITSGVDLTFFKRHPKLYWMLDCYGMKTGLIDLDVSHWGDIQVNGGEISAVPFFAEHDPFAIQLYNKVEHGTIRAVNVVFEYLDFDANISNWKTGQKLPSVTKSVLKYASLSDGMGEENSTVLHAENNIICLKRYKKEQTSINKLQYYTPQKMDNSKNNTDKATWANEHSDETNAIVENAVVAGKYTRAEAADLLATTPPDEGMVKAMKDVIRKRPIKPDQVKRVYHPTLVKLAATKTYDDIIAYNPGGFKDMQYSAPELYKAKFFEKFGRLPAALPLSGNY